MPKKESIGSMILANDHGFLRAKERAYTALDVAETPTQTTDKEQEEFVIRAMLEKQARLDKAHKEAMHKITEILGE